MSAQATRFGWILLLGTALGVRAAAVVWLAPIDPQRDGYEHAPIARHWLAGQGFTVRFLGATGPTSQQAPFYPALLAGCYGLLGVDTVAAVQALEWLQVLAGVALVGAVVRLVWSLVPQRSVGWAAGWFAALYPPHVYMVTHVQVAVWASLAGVLFLTLLSADMRHASARSRWRQAVAGGVAAGGALLVEPILALLLPVGWWLYTGRECVGPDGRRRVAWETLIRPAAVALVAAVVIAPWMIRNRLVHGEWVFIKSTFGYAFWQGNNPASWGTDKVPLTTRDKPATPGSAWAAQDRWLRDQRLATRYVDDVALTAADYAQLSPLSEPARSRWLAGRARDWIAAHPKEYAWRCARRLKFFLLFDETNPKCAHPLYQASTIVWLMLTSIGALIGLQGRTLSPHRHTRNEQAVERTAAVDVGRTGCDWQRRQLWPLYAIALLWTAFHSLVITSARFRIPMEVLTFTWPGLVLGPPIARLIEAVERTAAHGMAHETIPPPAAGTESPIHRAHELRGPHRPRVLRRRALWQTVSRRRDSRD